MSFYFLKYCVWTTYIYIIVLPLYNTITIHVPTDVISDFDAYLKPRVFFTWVYNTYAYKKTGSNHVIKLSTYVKWWLWSSTAKKKVSKSLIISQNQFSTAIHCGTSDRRLSVFRMNLICLSQHDHSSIATPWVFHLDRSSTESAQLHIRISSWLEDDMYIHMKISVIKNGNSFIHPHNIWEITV